MSKRCPLEPVRTSETERIGKQNRSGEEGYSVIFSESAGWKCSLFLAKSCNIFVYLHHKIVTDKWCMFQSMPVRHEQLLLGCTACLFCASINKWPAILQWTQKTVK